MAALFEVPVASGVSTGVIAKAERSLRSAVKNISAYEPGATVGPPPPIVTRMHEKTRLSPSRPPLPSAPSTVAKKGGKEPSVLAEEERNFSLRFSAGLARPAVAIAESRHRRSTLRSPAKSSGQEAINPSLVDPQSRRPGEPDDAPLRWDPPPRVVLGWWLAAPGAGGRGGGGSGRVEDSGVDSAEGGFPSRRVIPGSRCCMATW